VSENALSLPIITKIHYYILYIIYYFFWSNQTCIIWRCLSVTASHIKWAKCNRITIGKFYRTYEYTRVIFYLSNLCGILSYEDIPQGLFWALSHMPLMIWKKHYRKKCPVSTEILQVVLWNIII